uniref:Uncharacterized protein n=1 Tax=Entomoneis paludosa TaxID=265537 RepID=A0A7S2YMY5_9STRA
MAQGANGATALHLALSPSLDHYSSSRRGPWEELGKWIAAQGANLMEQFAVGATELHWEPWARATDELQLATQLTISFSRRGPWKELAKWLAAQDGVDLNAKDEYGRAPLHFACTNGHLEMVQLLASGAGEDLMAQNANGKTPLHLAAFQGHFRVVRWLLTQGVVLAELDSIIL